MTKIKAHTYFLLDRSGSMATKWTDTIGGLQAYCEKLGSDAELDAAITLATFDTIPGYYAHADRTVTEWPLKAIAATFFTPGDLKNILPRGGTPLYDAIVEMVEHIMSDPKRQPKPVLVILSDGGENESRKANRETARQALARIKDIGGDVVYLGANFDNYATGAGLGISRATTMSTQSYDSATASAGFAGTAQNNVDFVKGVAGSMAYNAGQKRAFGDKTADASDEVPRPTTTSP